MSGQGIHQPGTTVPHSGHYRCEWCGAGGRYDLTNREAHHLMEESLEMTPGSLPLDDKYARHAPRRVIEFFEENASFAACPNCLEATEWSLVAAPTVSTRSRPWADLPRESVAVAVLGLLLVLSFLALWWWPLAGLGLSAKVGLTVLAIFAVGGLGRFLGTPQGQAVLTGQGPSIVSASPSIARVGGLTPKDTETPDPLPRTSGPEETSEEETRRLLARRDQLAATFHTATPEQQLALFKELDSIRQRLIKLRGQDREEEHLVRGIIRKIRGDSVEGRGR